MSSNQVLVPSTVCPMPPWLHPPTQKCLLYKEAKRIFLKHCFIVFSLKNIQWLPGASGNNFNFPHLTLAEASDYITHYLLCTNMTFLFQAVKDSPRPLVPPTLAHTHLSIPGTPAVQHQWNLDERWLLNAQRRGMGSSCMVCGFNQSESRDHFCSCSPLTPEPSAIKEVIKWFLMGCQVCQAYG